MADFKLIKNENPEPRQNEIVDRLCYSSSTLQRYRNDINMVPPYRIQPNNNNKRTKKTSNTNFDNNLRCEYDLKRPQIASLNLIKIQNLKRETKCFKSWIRPREY